MAVVDANYATVVAACRRVLANGTNLTGDEVQLVLDVAQHATSNEKDAAATSLSAALVTALALWDADGAGDSSATYTAQEAILTPLRVAAIVGTAITDIAASDGIDGRPRR